MIEQVFKLLERAVDVFAEQVSVERERLRICQKEYELSLARQETELELNRASTENHRTASANRRAERELDTAKEAYAKLNERVALLEALWVRSGAPGALPRSPTSRNGTDGEST
jgi:hypothetical protein